MFKITEMKYLILTLYLVVLSIDLQAQRISIENILSFNVHQAGSITNNEKIEGHYLLYSLGKGNKKDKKYVLRILDTELNKVVDKNIIMNPFVKLVDVKSNGRSLAFRFLDLKERSSTIKIYDYVGNLLTSKKIDFKKSGGVQLFAHGEDAYKDLVFEALPDFGYLHVSPQKNKKLNYSMNFISDDSEVKSYLKTGDSEISQRVSNIFVSKNLIINQITAWEKGLPRRVNDLYIQCINSQSGQEEFSTKLESLEYNIDLLNGETSADHKNIILYGLILEDGKSKTSRPKGMIKIIFNRKGEIINSYTFDWKDKSIKLDQGEEAGNLFVHDFISSDNGNTFLITEQINKQFDPYMLSSPDPITTFTVDDIVIIELDKEFNLVSTQVIEKQKNDYSFKGLVLGKGIKMISQVAKGKGYFDYAYNQVTDEGFMIAYVNYERKKGKKNGFVFGGATYTDGEYSFDKIDISNKGISTRVLQAKPGYVILMDYIRKEKTLEMRLEKINF